MNPAQRLGEAFRLLQSGRGAEALAIARSASRDAPGSADALHLLALCRKATGDVEGALEAFGRALQLAPRDPNLLGNFANLLGRVGRPAEAIANYRRALEVAPTHADGWLNLGLTLLEAGDSAAAREALDRALALRPTHAASWQALGSARRAAGDLSGAEAALREAVRLAPGSGAAWTSLGVVRRLLGDPTEALECYAAARGAGFATAELEDAEASALLDLGEVERAHAAARRLTQLAPGYAAGHLMLAHILWEHGASLAPGEDPAAGFAAAVAAQPTHRALGQAYLRFLIDAGRHEAAVNQARALRGDVPDLPVMAAEAIALEELGEAGAAGRLFASGAAQPQVDANFLHLYARHLLRRGDPEAAASRAMGALELDPDDQPALAYLGVAWRLLGDDREHWLCDYERLVGAVDVEPPAGYASQASFLAALESTLLGLHRATREPVNQSLRGGSQTSGVLFGRRDPVIAATREAIAAAVARYAAALPDDPTHPFLRRKSARVRFVGSWSVRLRSGGNHIDHFHQEGWLSSAFYVALPPSVHSATAGDAGCIRFGQPPPELGTGLGPRRVLRPSPGSLALFPSYLWHGTVPFTDDAPRLTIAFDAQPEPAAG
jgi:tetratricopeptide (TPR) repeat protein